MRFPLILLYVFLSGCSISGSADASQREENAKPAQSLSCAANYQVAGPGTEVKRIELPIVRETSSVTDYEVHHEGLDFKVSWNRPLSSLYMTIVKNQATLAFSTSRVPTQDHNDSMMDIRLPGGPRLYLSCDFVEYRP